MRLIDADKLANSLENNLQSFEKLISKYGKGLTHGTRIALNRIAEQPTISPESLRPQWIPVTERMPREHQIVVGWTKDNPFSCYREEVVTWNGKGWVFVYAQRYVTNVKYWMPLPKPYKPEGGGKRMKPILFKTEAVKAILDGRKTVMRRVLEEKERLDKKHGLDREPYKSRTGEWCVDKQTDVDDYRTCVLKPRYQPGDVLYVRETWYKDPARYMYKANYSDTEKFFRDGKEVQIKWRPSIHMPKEAARLFLRVTDVRVERLQDITYEGCKAEGFDGVIFEDGTEGLPTIAINRFSRMWDSTIKKKNIGLFGWEANPWVWVIEFERISREEAEKEEND